eukprot:gene18008-21445_t
MTQEGGRALAAWTPTSAETRLSVAETVVAHPDVARREACVDLLRWLLQPDPCARPVSMAEALEHAFFRDDLCGLRFIPAQMGIFMSHFQMGGGSSVRSLTDHIERAAPALAGTVWLDMNMRDITEDSMRRGVREKEVFLLFLTKGVFERWFVTHVELMEAVQRGKHIVLVHESDPQRGGHASFSDYIEEFEELTQCACARCSALGGAQFWRRARLFDQASSVPSVLEGHFAEATARLVVRRCRYEHLLAPEPWLEPVLASPSAAQLAIVHAAADARSADHVRLQLENTCPNLGGCTLLVAEAAEEAMQGCNHEVYFLTRRGAASSKMLSAMQSALQSGRPAVVVHDVDEREGFYGISRANLAEKYPKWLQA